VLDFEGLADVEPIQEFYNGGLGGFGSGPGPDFDLSFGADALAAIDQDAGGTGNFGGEPSPDTTMAFLTGSAVLNVPNGFDTGFSFFYSAINQPGIVEVFDGLDATGNLLATINLGLTPFNSARRRPAALRWCRSLPPSCFWASALSGLPLSGAAGAAEAARRPGLTDSGGQPRGPGGPQAFRPWARSNSPM
jgi:hypothetical protein